MEIDPLNSYEMKIYWIEYFREYHFAVIYTPADQFRMRRARVMETHRGEDIGERERGGARGI